MMSASTNLIPFSRTDLCLQIYTLLLLPTELDVSRIKYQHRYLHLHASCVTSTSHCCRCMPAMLVLLGIPVIHAICAYHTHHSPFLWTLANYLSTTTYSSNYQMHRLLFKYTIGFDCYLHHHLQCSLNHHLHLYSLPLPSHHSTAHTSITSVDPAQTRHTDSTHAHHPTLHTHDHKSHTHSQTPRTRHISHTTCQPPPQPLPRCPPRLSEPTSDGLIRHFAPTRRQVLSALKGLRFYEGVSICAEAEEKKGERGGEAEGGELSSISHEELLKPSREMKAQLCEGERELQK